MGNLLIAPPRKLSDKEYALIAFLDNEGAFKNIIPCSVRQILVKRSFDVTLGGSSIQRYVRRSAPRPNDGKAENIFDLGE